MISFPNRIEDYGTWYNIVKTNIEYSLRQKMFAEIRDKMVEDFIKEVEPKIEEMVDSIVVTEVQCQRNLMRMTEEFGIKVQVHVQKIEEL